MLFIASNPIPQTMLSSFTIKAYMGMEPPVPGPTIAHPTAHAPVQPSPHHPPATPPQTHTPPVLHATPPPAPPPPPGPSPPAPSPSTAPPPVQQSSAPGVSVYGIHTNICMRSLKMLACSTSCGAAQTDRGDCRASVIMSHADWSTF